MTEAHIEGSQFIPEVIFSELNNAIHFNFDDENINQSSSYFMFFEPIIDYIKNLNTSEQKIIKIHFNQSKDSLNEYEGTQKVLALLASLPNQEFIHFVFEK